MSLILPQPMEGPRVRIRPVAESDLPAMLELNSNAEVTRYLGFDPWKTMVEAQAWFWHISAQQEAGSAQEFVIVAKESGKVIGRCGLFEFERVNAQASLGYVLGRAYWGQGYMREALAVLIDSAFGEMALRRLEARVEAANIASGKVLQRLGFTREGVLRERWISAGEPMDAEVYGLLQREWLRGRGKVAETL